MRNNRCAPLHPLINTWSPQVCDQPQMSQSLTLIIFQNNKHHANHDFWFPSGVQFEVVIMKICTTNASEPWPSSQCELKNLYVDFLYCQAFEFRLCIFRGDQTLQIPRLEVKSMPYLHMFTISIWRALHARIQSVYEIGFWLFHTCVFSPTAAACQNSVMWFPLSNTDNNK